VAAEQPDKLQSGLALALFLFTMEKIVVVIPTYNEADNLPIMAAELRTLGIAGLSILFVDDNSPDGTGRIPSKAAWEEHTGLVSNRPWKVGLTW
jgi:dolichol-phosphate mannosyltransferase